MVRPSRRGILVLALGAVLAALPAALAPWTWPAWVIFCGLVLCLLGLDFLLAPPARGVVLELDPPATLHVGDPVEVKAALRIGSPQPIPFQALFDLSENLEPLPLFQGWCPPEGTQLDLRLVPRRRGEASVEAAWLRYRGPLGLLEKTTRLPLARRMAVVPDSGPVRRAALLSVRDRRAQAGLRIERYQGDGTEFDSLREFLEGDDHRSIHWRSSARHRTLLCRHYRAERNRQVVLAVDTGHLMCEPLSGGIPKLDHAVRAALHLAFVSLKSGDRVGLYGFDERPGLLLTPGAGLAHFRALARRSAELDYTDAETNFTLGLTSLSQQLDRRSLVVLLTDFVDSTTAELMLENLGRLARRHLVVFVGLRDPGLEALSRARPSGVLELNRAVVASSHLQERELVLRRLERLGLLTIDARPDRVGPELINRYLEIKRRELV